MKPATVYYSTTGDSFHRIADCPFYEMGVAIWDTDDPPVGWPSTPVFVERTVAEAMGSGKLPCVRCLPGLRAAWFQGTCEEDFGHKPVTGEGGRTLCARCATHVRPFRWDGDGEIFTGHSFLPVRWPCTSAIVLGLVPRPEGAEE